MRKLLALFMLAPLSTWAASPGDCEHWFKATRQALGALGLIVDDGYLYRRDGSAVFSHDPEPEALFRKTLAIAAGLEERHGNRPGAEALVAIDPDRLREQHLAYLNTDFTPASRWETFRSRFRRAPASTPPSLQDQIDLNLRLSKMKPGELREVLSKGISVAGLRERAEARLAAFEELADLEERIRADTELMKKHEAFRAGLRDETSPTAPYPVFRRVAGLRNTVGAERITRALIHHLEESLRRAASVDTIEDFVSATAPLAEVTLPTTTTTAGEVNFKILEDFRRARELARELTSVLSRASRLRTDALDTRIYRNKTRHSALRRELGEN